MFLFHLIRKLLRHNFPKKARLFFLAHLFYQYKQQQKVLKEVNGRPMIYWQIQRILQAEICPIVVATSTETSDDALVDFLLSNGIEVFRGSLTDVADRFHKTLVKYSPSYFVRLTADCPLVMPKLLQDMNKTFQKNDVDYLSNTIQPTYPDGLDIEFVATEAFERMLSINLSSTQREHVTMGLYQNSHLFKINQYENDIDLSANRWTVDYPDDLRFVREVYEFFKGQETIFTMHEIFNAIQSGAIKDNSLSSDLRNKTNHKEG